MITRIVKSVLGLSQHQAFFFGQIQICSRLLERIFGNELRPVRGQGTTHINTIDVIQQT